ncbi:MAG: phosphopyruvate hydratase [Elusimicrobia bacterium]|nr:phosphopyruvate hydratase [Elusimicrobiota bacterium]
MKNISAVEAREILDSRGNPTVEVEIVLGDGRSVRAAVPSGASKGAHEALELRDGDQGRYGGLGVLRACAMVREKIVPALAGTDPVDLLEVDRVLRELDATANKSVLGANAMLAVSLAAAKAGAQLRQKPLYRHLMDLYGTRQAFLPTPMFNVINGGRHADNNLAIQEFMIIPSAAQSFKEALRAAAETFRALKSMLAGRKDSTAVGDEGGFAPRDLDGPMEAMALLLEAAAAAGHAEKIYLALDLASSEFFEEGAYRLYPERPPLSVDEMIDDLAEWSRLYPIVSFEDPLAEDDWAGWAKLTAHMADLSGGEFKQGRPPLLIGDDLFVTNPERLRRGVSGSVGTAILIKPNQIGTLSETAEVIRLAHEHGYATVASHRSGETEDPALAHIAVGLGAAGIKSGSVSRSERLAKYNELLRIEEELGAGAYRGLAALGAGRASRV